jgi:hypothetical protein
MATITVTGVVTDGTASAPFSVTVTLDSINITSASVTPAVAAPGTLRTLTVVASGGVAALTATVNPVSGITFTPVTGQPAGTFAWTFVA